MRLEIGIIGGFGAVKVENTIAQKWLGQIGITSDLKFLHFTALPLILSGEMDLSYQKAQFNYDFGTIYTATLSVPLIVKLNYLLLWDEDIQLLLFIGLGCDNLFNLSSFLQYKEDGQNYKFSAATTYSVGILPILGVEFKLDNYHIFFLQARYHQGINNFIDDKWIYFGNLGYSDIHIDSAKLKALILQIGWKLRL